MGHYGIIVHSELYHHGIKGMKWGVRRYQNSDGTLTDEGMRRYSHMSPTKSDSSVTKRVKSDWHNLSNDQFMSKYKTSKDTYARRVKKYGDPYKNGTGPKIARALNKSGVANVANTINRKTGATKILVNGIKKNSQLDRKYKVRRTAAAAAGSLAVAALIAGGALAAKKKFSKGPTIEDSRKKIQNDLNTPEVIAPKVSNSSRVNTNFKKELNYLYDNRDVLLKDGTNPDKIKKNKQLLKSGQIG